MLTRAVLITITPVAVAASGVAAGAISVAVLWWILVGTLASWVLAWSWIQTRPASQSQLAKVEMPHQAGVDAVRKHFVAVFRMVPDLMSISRASDGRYLEVNAAFEQLTGLRRDQIVGRTPRELAIWPNIEHYESVLQALATTPHRGDSVLTELRDQHRAIHQVRVTGAVTIARGERYLVVLLHDVTQAHRAEQALRQSEARFASVFELAPLPMCYTTDRDNFGTTQWNQAWLSTFGYPAAACQGKAGTDFGLWVNPSDRARYIEMVAQGQRVDNMVCEMLRADGVRRSIAIYGRMVRSPERTLIITTFRDVTEQMKIEQRLLDSEAKLAAVFQASPSAMVVADISDGGEAILTTNGAWENQFGYAESECLGRSSAQLGIWRHETQRAQAFEEIERVGRLRAMDVPMVRRDGGELWCRVSARTVRVGSSKLLILVQDDVTSQRKAQEDIERLNLHLEERVQERTQQLQQSNAELNAALVTLKHAKDQLVHSEKLAALGALVAGIAHELNTPIGNGLTVASTMEDHVRDFSKAMQGGRLRRSELEQFVLDAGTASEIIVRNLTRAGALVTSFKQVSLDQASSQRRRFNLREIISEIVITLQPSIRASGCQIRHDVPVEMWLNSFPGPLGQALTNLINNAIIHGYGPQRAGPITIEANQASSTQWLELRVSDHGQGIEASHLKRVFDPFFTTRLGSGGSGLGLHIVHNIVNGLLGGHIEVLSEPDRGATFVMHLPCQAPPIQGEESPPH